MNCVCFSLEEIKIFAILFKNKSNQVSEDQDPSHSKVMCLNKVTLLSDRDSGSLVLSLHPLCQHQNFVYGKAAPLPVK